MTQIEINGKAFDLAYNFQTATTFQRMTGENPFDLPNINMDLQTLATIGYCMLLSNNETEDVPEFEQFIRSIADVKTSAIFLQAVNKEIEDFFGLQPGDPQPPEEKEEEPKND